MLEDKNTFLKSSIYEVFTQENIWKILGKNNRSARLYNAINVGYTSGDVRQLWSGYGIFTVSNLIEFINNKGIYNIPGIGRPEFINGKIVGGKVSLGIAKVLKDMGDVELNDFDYRDGEVYIKQKDR